MDKVKVSQEVADAMKELESWIGADKDRSEKVLKIAELLAYGYEVELTPEEKIHQYVSKYKEINEKYQALDVRIDAKGRISGVKFALDTLGIKIKGVNVD